MNSGDKALIFPFSASGTRIVFHNIFHGSERVALFFCFCVIIVNVNKRVKVEEALGMRLLFAGGRDGELVD